MRNRSFPKSVFFALAALTLALLPREARAERPSTSNALSFIVQMGQMGFTQGGGVFLPTAVLQSMSDGDVKPMMQYVLVNSMFSQCLEEVKKYTPSQRDPFKVAQSKYQYGICRLQRCQQQGMLILALPLISGVASAGGGSDQDGSSAANAQYAMSLAQGFQNASSCGGQGPAMDSALIQILTQN